MKWALNSVAFIPHPSALIPSPAPSLTVGLLPQCRPNTRTSVTSTASRKRAKKKIFQKL
jgi:hypothetical protein